jgi:hypothetical protein
VPEKFLLTEEELQELTVVEAERVAGKESSFLFAFFRDDTGELQQIASALADREEFPWKFSVSFEEGSGYLEFFVVITFAKPLLSTLGLQVKFRVNYWTFAQQGISCFFFSKAGDEEVVNPEGVFVKLPKEIVNYCEEKINEYGLTLFFDKVLKVGNPYSPQYVEGVWRSFVENRYRAAPPN